MSGNHSPVKRTPWALPSSLAEASWLAAAVVIPIAADLQARQIFTVPKAVLTESFGILSALALALQMLDASGRRDYFRKPAGSMWAMGAAILLMALSFVSWWFALDPSRAGYSEDVASLGPAHLGCQVAIFLSVAAFLRTFRQLERLALAALSAAFAIAGFALMQVYGFQAPGYPVVKGLEITSFVGGPIFLGGYMLMLLPVAAWNLHRQLEGSGGRFSCRVAAAAFVLLALGGAFLACNKRGPTVGLIAMGCSALMLLAIHRRRHALLTKAAVAAAAVAMGLTGLALIQKAGKSLSHVPFVERLAMIVPVGAETGDSYRSNLWALLPDLLLKSQPTTLPSGTPDPHHSLRRWLGFGPDNVQAILPSKYIFLQSWPSDVMEVSCHSHFWDLALSLGIAGVLVFFGLFFAVWYQGLLKIATQPPTMPMAAVIAFGSALAGGFIAAAVLHFGFFGIGMQAGFLAGLLGIGILNRTDTAPVASPSSGRELLLIAMMSALAGHWINLGFIFPTAENSILFWLFAGAIVARKKENEVSTDNAAPEHTILVAGVGSFLLMAGFYARANIGPVLAGHLGLEHLFGDTTTTTLFAGLTLVVLWAVCQLFANANNNPKMPSPCHAMIAVAAIYLAGIFWLVKSMLLNPPSPDRVWLMDAWALHFLLLSVGGVVLVASIVSAHRDSPKWATGAAAAGVAFLAACLVWMGAAQDMRSSVSAGATRHLPQADRWLERSIALRPQQLRNHRLLANRLVAESARVGISMDERDQLLLQAGKVLHQGLAVSKFNLLNAKLGRLYLRRALLTTDSHEKNQLALLAKELLQSAVWFAPQNEPAWVDMALVEQACFRNDAIAQKHLHRANVVTLLPPRGANVVEEAWGCYYAEQAKTADTEQQRRHYAGRALMYLRLCLVKSDLALISAGDDSARRARILLRRTESLACMVTTFRILGEENEATAALQEMNKLLKELKTIFK